jgi:hypothetical protein
MQMRRSVAALPIVYQIRASLHGSGWPHVVVSGSRNPKVNCQTTRQFYDSVFSGRKVTGCYFPMAIFDQWPFYPLTTQHLIQ